MAPLLAEEVGGKGGVVLHMENADGTELWIATVAKPYDFAMNPLFLVGESEQGKGSGP